jgi:GH15 family glucan-1,4-alpha-glucosidase
MTLPDQRLEAMRELVRSIECLSGTVPMRWRFAPRFNYGRALPRCEWRYGVPVATWRSDAVAAIGWDTGTPQWLDHSVGAEFEIRAGARAMLALVGAYAEPLVFPERQVLAQRLEGTIRFWQDWIAARKYDGPWRDEVARSALVLKALIFSASGASVAAATTSLPEEIGGARNWDYRFCWLRDSNFLIDALLDLGCYDEARSSFWWFMHATALTEPELRVMYRLDGAIGIPECELPLAGYRGSRPVRVGNGAYAQTQLDIYGALFETAWIYSEGHHRLDSDTGAVLGRIADRVCDIWRRPDCGIWEVRNGPFHFTHSKAMCWVALDRSVRLAERGEVPGSHVERWRREAAAVEQYIETECWSDRLRSYTRVAGGADDATVDASLLMLPLVGYRGFDGRGAERINGTIDAVIRELRDGDFVYRYKSDDGVPGGEGCFLNCSFWLVEALAHAGRADEAARLMESLLARANDVGLYSEEIDPRSGAFLGNLPQALVHLALINAACAIRGPRTK